MTRTDNIAHFQTTLDENKESLRTTLRENGYSRDKSESTITFRAA